MKSYQNDWGTLISQYQEGRRRVGRFSRNMTEEGQEEKDFWKNRQGEMAKEMFYEMGEAVSQLRSYHAGACRRFLRGEGERVLTRRQRQALDLKAAGYSYAEMGRRLGISRTAAYKLYQRCEEKMQENRQWMFQKEVNKSAGYCHVQKEVCL